MLNELLYYFVYPSKLSVQFEYNFIFIYDKTKDGNYFVFLFYPFFCVCV